MTLNGNGIAHVSPAVASRAGLDLETFPAALSGSWTEPDDIEAPLPPVPEFDPRLLPESLLPIVQDTADRMQVPIDFPAVAAIMCLAGVVNRRAAIQPKRADASWVVIPNLWGGIVASPGQKKSPAISAITAPLRAIESGWRQEQEAAMAEYELQAEEAELVKSAWRDGVKRAAKGKGSRPERPTFALQRPTARRLLTSDGTFEALHALLAHNAAGSRTTPMCVERFPYLFLLHLPLPILFWFLGRSRYRP